MIADLWPGAEKQWVVWSNEHNAWWASDRAGYRMRLREAGIYDEQEARECANTRTWNGKGVPPEEAMNLHDAVRFEAERLYKSDPELARELRIERLIRRSHELYTQPCYDQQAGFDEVRRVVEALSKEHRR